MSALNDESVFDIIYDEEGDNTLDEIYDDMVNLYDKMVKGLKILHHNEVINNFTLTMWEDDLLVFDGEEGQYNWDDGVDIVKCYDAMIEYHKEQYLPEYNQLVNDFKEHWGEDFFEEELPDISDDEGEVDGELTEPDISDDED